MSRFSIQATPISDLSVIQRQLIGDHRGYLERLFCKQELRTIIGNRTIVQINHTLTATRGTIRGMHFQYPPYAEMKLVTCLRGEVFDVAVDLRQGSPTFLKWHAEYLSADNHKSLAIPEGFAHGFQTLADDCELLYLHTTAYQSDAEAGLDALDPAVGVTWPLPVRERSERDQNHAPTLSDFIGLEL